LQSIVILVKSKYIFSYHQNRRHVKRYDIYHGPYEKIVLTHILFLMWRSPNERLDVQYALKISLKVFQSCGVFLSCSDEVILNITFIFIILRSGEGQTLLFQALQK